MKRRLQAEKEEEDRETNPVRKEFNHLEKSRLLSTSRAVGESRSLLSCLPVADDCRFPEYDSPQPSSSREVGQGGVQTSKRQVRANKENG
jgi:hypothetical protein